MSEPASAGSGEHAAAPRPSDDRAWTTGVLILLLAFTGVVLGPALLGRGVLLDVGLLRGYWPFQGNGAVQDAIVCRGDTVNFYLPGVANIREALHRGALVTWSPYEVGGAPLASLPNHAILSPLSWPYLVLPLWLAPAFVKLTELVVVVVGMTLLLGRFGVRRSAGMLAGLVFFTSGFMVMWSNWPHTKVAAVIPLLFWSLDRTVTRRRPIDCVLVALTVAAMLLGGFPAVTMYALTFGATYVLVRGLQEARRHGLWALLTGWAGAAVGVLLGAGTSAIQLLPFAANLSAIGYEARVPTGTHALGYLTTVLAPGAAGGCRGANQGLGPANPVEGTAFLGVGALVLILVAATVTRTATAPRRPVLLGSMLLAAVVLLWIGGPPLDLLQTLPGYNHNSIRRMLSVFGFLGAALAGFGFDLLQRRAADGPLRSARRRTRILVGAALVMFTLVLLALALADAHDWAAGRGRASTFVSEVAIAGVLMALALVGVGLTLWGRGGLRFAGPTLVALIVVTQSTAFAHQLLPLSERRDFYPVTETHRFLKANIGHDRYAGDSWWGEPGTSDFYRLRTPVGHEFTAPDWKAVLAAVDPHVQASRTYSSFSRHFDTSTIGDQPLLDQLSVRLWATDPGTVLGALGPGRPTTAQGRVRLDADRRASCSFPATPLRGVQLELAAPFRSGPARRVLHTRVTTPGGTVEGARTLVGVFRKGSPIRVALLGQHLGASPAAGGTATVEAWITGEGPEVLIAGQDRTVHCRPVVPPPTDDNLELVFAHRNSLVYERETALPRIRWAGRSEVVPDPDDQLDLLADGIGDDTVLVDSGRPVTTAASADLDILEDRPETMRVAVDADGPGYVVLADSIARDGWTARVDGRATPIVDTNRALAAVRLDEGQHLLVLRYEAPGLRTGSYVTALSLLVALALCLWSAASRFWPRRHRSTGPRATDPPTHG